MLDQIQMQLSGSLVCDDKLPPLSAKYPWVVAQSLEAEEDLHQFFYNINNPSTHYLRRIPELVGKHIRGYFHGWVVLSDQSQKVTWSLWNPMTSKIIHLPQLTLEDQDSPSIGDCCLSSPPDDPTSVLLLTRTDKPTFVFCRLDDEKTRNLKWAEMSYAEDLSRISNDGRVLYNITICNGKIFALTRRGSFAKFVVHVEIVVRDGEVLINLLLLGAVPHAPYNQCQRRIIFLKGSSTNLFCLTVGIKEKKKETVGFVSLCKLDMTIIEWEKTMERFKDWNLAGMDPIKYNDIDLTEVNASCDMWERMKELKDTVFFVNLARDRSIFCSSVNGYALGGDIHMRSKTGKVIYSYHLKDDTISLSSVPYPVLPTSHVSVWECRLEDDHEEYNTIGDYRREKEDTSTPLIEWSDNAELTRLQTKSVDSPWLMMVDQNRGIVTFTDPMSGDKHFMEKLPISLYNSRLYYSKFGWLFVQSEYGLVFYNPFTNDIRELPDLYYVCRSFCFSAPPTSPDCMVVGFTLVDDGVVYILNFAEHDPSWKIVHLVFNDVDQYTFHFPTIYGPHLYGLCNDGELIVFKNLGETGFCCGEVVTGAPKSSFTSMAKHYLTKCDQHLFQVIVGEFGKSVEVFRFNESTKEWEQIYDLGKNMMYICDTTCLSIEAKSRDMENKIYFPRLHSANGKIVFYSLETGMNHTSSGGNVDESFGDFFGTTHYLNPHTWIQPSF